MRLARIFCLHSLTAVPERGSHPWPKDLQNQTSQSQRREELGAGPAERKPRRPPAPEPSATPPRGSGSQLSPTPSGSQEPLLGSLCSRENRLLTLYLLVPTGEPQKPPPYICSLPGSTHLGTGHWVTIYHEGAGWRRKGSFASYQTDA